jgi:hypothetical protein
MGNGCVQVYIGLKPPGLSQDLALFGTAAASVPLTEHVIKLQALNSQWKSMFSAVKSMVCHSVVV